jgi:hypothetical protein
MKLPISVATKFKRMGYKAGTPDLLIFEPQNQYNGMFLELKTEKGTKTTSQKKFLKMAWERGYYATTAYGYNNAIALIDNYLKGEVL